MARLGLPSNAKPLDFPDEAAKYDTSVTVAEDYAAHLKAQRERAARAREGAVKEKEEEEERERLAAEEREARRKRYFESEEEEEGEGDAEQTGKESDAIVADEKCKKGSKRRNVFGRLKSYFGRRVFGRCRKET